jgi:hypothetical protein
VWHIYLIFHVDVSYNSRRLNTKGQTCPINDLYIDFWDSSQCSGTDTFEGDQICLGRATSEISESTLPGMNSVDIPPSTANRASRGTVNVCETNLDISGSHGGGYIFMHKE